MYLFLSLAKINFFIDLIGLVLVGLNSDSTGLEIALMATNLALLMAHFGMLAATHMQQTRCARKRSWRIVLLCALAVKITVLTFAMYLRFGPLEATP